MVTRKLLQPKLVIHFWMLYWTTMLISMGLVPAKVPWLALHAI
ncbi:hypothetical protein AHF37_06295 [Paragonimus kellicotti]|nr:hypothetical protein AHF37_06295 [Paragonimus kellicotti]